MDRIVEFIERAFAFIKNIFRKIINGIINFKEHVVGWFKSLHLVKNKQVPFIADGSKLKEMLGTAPVKNVGIFEGVYDMDADEIIENQYLDANGEDAKTRQILANEPLVVLN